MNFKSEMDKENESIFNEVFKNGLLNKYSVEKVDIEEYWNIYYNDFFNQYPEEINFDREGLLNNSQLQKRKNLNIMNSSLKIENNLVVKDNGQIIALFRSEQESADIYYMRHAVVHKDYRRQGIYMDYLNKILHYAHHMGFSQVVSCFVAANHLIYKAKIKKDFYVTSLEINPEYGNIVWISHFLNEDLKKAFLFRSGMVEFSKKLFQNSEGNANKLLNKLVRSSLS
ncbi:GNAT family N-acetyltransferase [Silvanigrella aquatica]|uniref:N-acetyltransferase domain-containing protein n=1 Tax=Silvanigrella aquatica TaxID=1915309 RepID=A0A1L4D178_9BACT|nr:GNAT family N-acetyltransferase [Silvanigrella aquatica]APJ03948.1 hypothetical protein AXG55_08530 [Silvanigrella aquatica]